MECCYGAMNTKGFSSALDNYQIPDQTHITYSGLFNQLSFSIGPKAKKPMELHIGYARAQNMNSQFDSQINNYLTVFTKGKKDGEDRDQRILNSVIILDISGSMGSGLTSTGEGCRLELAKQAILMFFSKLRPTDSFGLVVFNNSGTTIIPVTKVSELQFEQVSTKIKAIHTNGGTTMMSGFKQAHRQLQRYLSQSQYAKTHFENRMIMLTDVCDNQVETSKNFIKQVEASDMHTTIIGISDEFRSQVCQSLIEVKGFNYFCATELEDLKKYLFENFSFTFFPANEDIQIAIESEQITGIQVYGTVDADKVVQYNKNADNKFIITKTKSSFPSELEITEEGEVKTFGGLILIKLNLKNKDVCTFDGKINLKYREATTKQEHHQQYPLHYESPANQQYYSDQSLYEAISAFFYGFQAKNILKTIKSTSTQNPEKKNYISSLKKMREQVPKSKLEELEKLIKTLENNRSLSY